MLPLPPPPLPPPHTHTSHRQCVCVCLPSVRPALLLLGSSPRCPPPPLPVSHTPTHPPTHSHTPPMATHTHPHAPQPMCALEPCGCAWVCLCVQPSFSGRVLPRFFGEPPSSPVPRGRIHAQATTGHQTSAPLLPHWLCNAPRARVRGTPTTAWPLSFLFWGWRARPFFVLGACRPFWFLGGEKGNCTPTPPPSTTPPILNHCSHTAHPIPRRKSPAGGGTWARAVASTP